MAESIPAGSRLTSAMRRAQYRHVGEARGGVGEVQQPPCSVDESAGGFPPIRPLAYPVSFELEGAPGLVAFTWGTPSIVSAYDHRGCIRPDLCSRGDRLTECGDLWTPATGVIGSTAWDDDLDPGPFGDGCCDEQYAGQGELPPISAAEYDRKADDAREIRRILEDA